MVLVLILTLRNINISFHKRSRTRTASISKCLIKDELNKIINLNRLIAIHPLPTKYSGLIPTLRFE